MWELNCEESWALKNWCFWTVVLEKTLESPLDYKEIQLVHPKGNQSWIFIGRTDVETETPILWPPDVKSWLIWKEPDAGKDWRQEEKGTTEDEMVGWHHWLNGHGFGWTPGVGDGQGGLACLWFMGSQRVGHDWATELNWTELNLFTQEPSLILLIPSHRASILTLRRKKKIAFLQAHYTHKNVICPFLSYFNLAGRWWWKILESLKGLEGLLSTSPPRNPLTSHVDILNTHNPQLRPKDDKNKLITCSTALDNNAIFFLVLTHN